MGSWAYRSMNIMILKNGGSVVGGIQNVAILIVEDGAHIVLLMHRQS